MAFELQLSVFNSGLESQAAQALSALKYFATLATPVTETVMRTALETAQLQAFSNDGWDNFMRVVAQTPLNSGSLTVAERAIVNTIREVVNPSPKYSCCGSTTPALLDGKTTPAGYYRTGSTAPWQYVFEIVCDVSYDCDIDTIDVTISPIFPGPATSSANPHTFTSNGCDENGNRVFDYLWVEFASDPATESYTLLATYKDTDGIVIATYLLNSTVTL